MRKNRIFPCHIACCSEFESTLSLSHPVHPLSSHFLPIIHLPSPFRPFPVCYYNLAGICGAVTTNARRACHGEVATNVMRRHDANCLTIIETIIETIIGKKRIMKWLEAYLKTSMPQLHLVYRVMVGSSSCAKCKKFCVWDQGTWWSNITMRWHEEICEIRIVKWLGAYL